MKAPQSGKLMLHVGCGDVHIPGFIHVDVRALAHVDVVAPADKLTQIEDDSVDLLYNCHVLEHVRRGEETKVLKEWYRVLKRGGILRTAVPDFARILAWYQRTGNLDELLGLLHGRQDHEYNIHYQTYDFPRLETLLKSVGFRDIRRYDWRETIHKDYDDFSQAYLPHMDKEKGMLMSLNVETTK
ncbi:methyltransferase domain-containing protein [Acidobacteriia bacterium AH_259_A11_L15]|nr:methyltransferase domain-containing protein [Acidobacteriia bacterium AH_259_A11_L15]